MLPPPPILDVRANEWILDACFLKSACAGPGVLHFVQTLFAGRAHIADEAVEELKRGPTWAQLRRGWLTEESVMVPADAELYRRLRKRWGSGEGRDEGEAASIVLAKRNGWWMLTDDATGFASALDEGVCCTRTTAFLLALARVELLTADRAWAAYQAMLAAGRRLGDPPWADEPDFRRSCAIRVLDDCSPDAPEEDDTSSVFTFEIEATAVKVVTDVTQ